MRPLLLALVAATAACSAASTTQPEGSDVGPNPVLAAPERQRIPTVDVAPAKGWPQGMKPQSPAGWKVVAFAADLQHPRWLYVLPNGDVLVAETNAPERPDEGKGLKSRITQLFMKKAGAGTPSANRIVLLRDADGDGIAETRSVFLDGLTSPFGMALIGDRLYVANTDAVVRFTYRANELRITTAGEKVADLPAGTRNHHWTKNLIASRDGAKLYVTVGSNSNVAEHGMEEERGRAAIWELDIASGRHREFATGLRNANGLAWQPQTGALWAVVNERDELGNDLVPDYLTSVKDSAFYGWPYSYYGQNVDARVKEQDPGLVAKATKPDYALGSHVAALGLTWSDGKLGNGMIIGEHGSWNRKPKSGYKVVLIPFRSGQPFGKPVDLLTGFLSPEDDAWGRPVGVAIDKRGALLVADDVGNTVWRTSPD